MLGCLDVGLCWCDVVLLCFCVIVGLCWCDVGLLGCWVVLVWCWVAEAHRSITTFVHTDNQTCHTERPSTSRPPPDERDIFSHIYIYIHISIYICIENYIHLAGPSVDVVDLHALVVVELLEHHDDLRGSPPRCETVDELVRGEVLGHQEEEVMWFVATPHGPHTMALHPVELPHLAGGVHSNDGQLFTRSCRERVKGHGSKGQ